MTRSDAEVGMLKSGNREQATAWVLQAYGAVEDLRLEPISPPKPNGAQLLLKVEATGLNPLDLKLISGAMAGFMPVPFPFVPGTDLCGVVESVGPDVTDLQPGDRVVGMTTANGAMATHALCDRTGAVVRAPAALSAADLASLPEAGMTALAILRAANLQPGQTVAVIGATGGVGLLFCQLASRAGGRVIATAAPGDEDLVLRNGAAEVVGYGRVDTIDAILEKQPGGVDALVDLVHQFDALPPSARAIREGGRLLSTLMGPQADAFKPGVEICYIRLAPSAAELQRLVDDLAEGRLSANVTRRFAFSEASQAYRELRDGHARGKIVVEHC